MEFAYFALCKYTYHPLCHQDGHRQRRTVKEDALKRKADSLSKGRHRSADAAAEDELAASLPRRP